MKNLDEMKMQQLKEQIEKKVAFIEKGKIYLSHMLSRLVDEYGDLCNYVSASVDEEYLARVTAQRAALSGVMRHLTKYSRLSSNGISKVGQFIQDVEDLDSRLQTSQEEIKAALKRVEDERRDLGLILSKLEEFPPLDIRSRDTLLDVASKETLQKRKLAKK